MKLKTSLMSMILTFSLLASSIVSADDISEGKDIAFDRKKGNCLSCHLIIGGEMPGNIGPPLMMMKVRFTEERLRSQIYDATKVNPNSLMPPFGKHHILSKDEIDKVVKYIRTL